MKHAKEEWFTVDTFKWNIESKVQNRERGWYVSKTGREVSKPFPNESISIRIVVFSRWALATDDFDNSPILMTQTSSLLTSSDKNDLAETWFQELHEP